MRRLMVLVVACALVGCGGSGSKHATLRQVASVVSENGPIMRDRLAKVDRCLDLSDSCGRGDYYLIGRLQVEANDFDSGFDDVQTQAGGPPREVAPLVERTRRALAEVSKQAGRFGTECPELQGCYALMNDLNGANSEVSRVLNAWQPFLR